MGKKEGRKKQDYTCKRGKVAAGGSTEAKMLESTLEKGRKIFCFKGSPIEKDLSF